MDNQIDAVMVSTPDHTHAPISAMAMRMGKHCYCEKPLAHSVFETRTLTNIAREKTQMGTQIHAERNYRRAVELVQAGAIGEVGEAHVWIRADFRGPPQPTSEEQRDAPADRPPVPKNLDWDLWLGPAAYRPYHPAYVPFNWRFWWAFGNGLLGDFFCHYSDLVFWALGLSYPTTIEAEGSVHPQSAAQWTIARQEYPARGALPPVALTWYHGGPYPAWLREKDVPLWESAVLFVGAKGMLIADYNRYVLLPKKEFAGFRRPAPTIPDSIGHQQEWIAACKTGRPTTCNFDYSGPLTEAALLCNVALRTGKKLHWNSTTLRAIGCPEAGVYLHPAYRSGWTL
jgi:predicted dehydrogenase